MDVLEIEIEDKMIVQKIQLQNEEHDEYIAQHSTQSSRQAKSNTSNIARLHGDGGNRSTNISILHLRVTTNPPILAAQASAFH